MINVGARNRLLFTALISALLSVVYFDRNALLLVEAFSSTKSSSTNYYNVNSRNHHRILKGSTLSIKSEDKRMNLYSHNGRGRLNSFFSHEEKNDGSFVGGGGGGNRHRRKFMINKLISRTANRLKQMRLLMIRKKIRRAVLVFSTVAFLWLGSAQTQTSPCHASSASSTISEPIVVCTKDSASTTMYKPIFSSSFDRIIDKYVKKHMFDDDAYDAIESTYREAYSDRNDNLYSDQLNQITEDIVGQPEIDVDISQGVKKKEVKKKITIFNLIPMVIGTVVKTILVTILKFTSILKFLFMKIGIPKGIASLASAIAGFGSAFYGFVTIFLGSANVFKVRTDKSLKRTYKGKFDARTTDKEDIDDDDDDYDEKEDSDDEEDDDDSDDEDDDDDDDED